MSEWIERSLSQLTIFQKGRKVDTSSFALDGYSAYLGASGIEGRDDGYGDPRFGVSAKATDTLMLWDGERSGLVGFGREGIVASTVTKLSPNDLIEPKFLYFALLAQFSWIQHRRTGTGVPHVPKDLGRILKISFPKRKALQRRIVSILSTIDTAIEQTEALIEKHQHIKAGLMHDLFTRGLLPNGQLRPPREQALELYQESEIGWIPREWGVAKIEGVLNRIIDYRGKTPEKTIDGIPLITAKNVRMGYIDPEPREFIAERAYASWMTRGIPSKGDILFTTEAPLGNVAQVPSDERVAFAQRAIILQPSEQVDSAFLAYRLMTEVTQNAIARLSSGSTALGIKQSEFRKIRISYPSSKREQLDIAKRLRSPDGLIDQELNTLRKLQTQKLGLMQDLLTGKVPVKVKTDPSEVAGG
jgi:type I restriction enzyme, S subunit